MIHRILRFTLVIAICCVLHRCKSQDIHCQKLSEKFLPLAHYCPKSLCDSLPHISFGTPSPPSDCHRPPLNRSQQNQKIKDRKLRSNPSQHRSHRMQTRVKALAHLPCGRPGQLTLSPTHLASLQSLLRAPILSPRHLSILERKRERQLSSSRSKAPAETIGKKKKPSRSRKRTAVVT